MPSFVPLIGTTRLALAAAVVLPMTCLGVVASSPSAHACGYSAMVGSRTLTDSRDGWTLGTITLYYDSCQRSTWAELDVDYNSMDCHFPSGPGWWLAVDLVDQNGHVVSHGDSNGFKRWYGVVSASQPIDKYPSPKSFQARGWVRTAYSDGSQENSVFFDSDWHQYSTGGDPGGGWNAALDSQSIC